MAYGDSLDKAGRYARTDEFLDIVTALWRGETVDFAGEYLQVQGATLPTLPVPTPAVLRRLVRTGRTGRGQAHRRLPDGVSRTMP